MTPAITSESQCTSSSTRLAATATAIAAGAAREQRAHAGAAAAREDQRERRVERGRGRRVAARERRAERLGDRVERRPGAVDELLDAVRDRACRRATTTSRNGHEVAARRCGAARRASDGDADRAATAGQSPRSVTSCSRRVDECVAWSLPQRGRAGVDRAQRRVAADEQREHADDDARRRSSARRPRVSARPVATAGSRPRAATTCAPALLGRLLDRLGGRAPWRPARARGDRTRARPARPAARAIEEEERGSAYGRVAPVRRAAGFSRIADWRNPRHEPLRSATTTGTLASGRRETSARRAHRDRPRRADPRCSTRRPARVARALAHALADRTAALVVLPHDARSATSSSRRSRSASASCSSTSCCRCTRSGTTTRRSTPGSRAQRTPHAERRVLRRLVDRRHPVHPGARDPRRRSAAAIAAPLARRRRSIARRDPVEVATYRVASLIVHRERPTVAAARPPAGQPELSRRATSPRRSSSTSGSRC